jgi:DNA gyrase subunit A
VIEDAGSVSREDLIAEEENVVVVTEADYVKRMALSEFDPQHRGGKGIIGTRPKEGDRVSTVFTASTHDYLLCFTNQGQVYRLKVFELPEMGRTARGTSAVNVLDLDDGEEITAVVNTDDIDAGYLAMATRGGYVKRTAVSEFENVHSGGIRAVSLEDDDALVDVEVTSGEGDLLIGTRRGMTIRFAEEDARPMGRSARGVNGVKLEGDDRVAGLVAADPVDDRDLLTVTRNGFGKRTALTEYRQQSRYGKGLIDIKTDARNGEVCAINAVAPGDGLVIMSEAGQIMRTDVDEVSEVGRNTKGVVVMELDEGDRVAGVDVVDNSGDDGSADGDEDADESAEAEASEERDA